MQKIQGIKIKDIDLIFISKININGKYIITTPDCLFEYQKEQDRDLDYNRLKIFRNERYKRSDKND